jgi:hypothetical protein
LAGTLRIPEWFEHQCKGPSISFWFRNKLPSLALFFVTKPMHNKLPNNHVLSLRVNGFECDIDDPYDGIYIKIIKLNHAYLFDLQLQDRDLNYNLDESFLRNEWICVEVTCVGSMVESLFIESGIHVFKQKSSMEDIRFINPYKQKVD